MISQKNKITFIVMAIILVGAITGTTINAITSQSNRDDG